MCAAADQEGAQRIPREPGSRTCTTTRPQALEHSGLLKSMSWGPEPSPELSSQELPRARLESQQELAPSSPSCTTRLPKLPVTDEHVSPEQSALHRYHMSPHSTADAPCEHPHLKRPVQAQSVTFWFSFQAWFSFLILRKMTQAMQKEPTDALF